MSGFIRPELRRQMTRWAEPIMAAGVALLGLMFLVRGLQRYNFITEAIGVVLLLIGAAAFWAAFRRVQFRQVGKGPGLVDVTERRITYMTSLGGDSVDLEAMTRLEIRNSMEFGRVWALKQAGGPTLFIPVAAAGSEKLFDVFAVLPDIDVAHMVASVNSSDANRTVIWRGDGRFPALT